MYCNLCLRVDGVYTFLHDIYLVFADGLPGSDDLTVNIRQTDLIVIDQIKGSYTTAGQSLHHITADTADAEDSNSCAVQALHGFLADQ